MLRSPPQCPGRPDIPNAKWRPSCAASRHRHFRHRQTSCRIPQLKLPNGLQIEVYASGIANAALAAARDKGPCFAATCVDQGLCHHCRTGNARRRFIASGWIADGLAFHNGTLYIAEGTKISKLEKIRGQP